MSERLKVVRRENVEAFDRLTLNAEHRLEFDSGELTAVYPESASETDYRVAMFPVEGGAVELPDGSAVLSADGPVIALVPEEQYD